MSDLMFDQRLERAARRIADEAVRPIDALAIAESAKRAAEWDEPWTPVLRRPRTWLAMAAAVVLLVIGTAVLADRFRGDVGQPVPSLRPSVVPTPSLLGSPSPDPTSAGATAGGGTWLADIPAGLEFTGAPASTRMSLNVTSGPVARIDLDSGPKALHRSSFETFGVGEVRLTTLDTVRADGGHAAGDAVTLNGTTLGGCDQGDQGQYRFASSQDGLLLTLTVVAEACPSREAVLARTWTRLLTVPNGGGIGVVDGFDPLFTVVLPAGSYAVDREIDARTIRQELPELQFISWKDPQGFLDPCDRSKGRREIAPGPDAFVAYFRQLAGFTVDSTEAVTVDGYPAVHLVVHADEEASCPGGQLWQWQTKNQSGDTGWFLRPGVTDSLYIVNHPAGTVMFELLPAPNSLEAQVIGSIRFLERLPTQP